MGLSIGQREITRRRQAAINTMTAHFHVIVFDENLISACLFLSVIRILKATTRLQQLTVVHTRLRHRTVMRLYRI